MKIQFGTLVGSEVSPTNNKKSQHKQSNFNQITICHKGTSFSSRAGKSRLPTSIQLTVNLLSTSTSCMSLVIANTAANTLATRVSKRKRMTLKLAMDPVTTTVRLMVMSCKQINILARQLVIHLRNSARVLKLPRLHRKLWKPVVSRTSKKATLKIRKAAKIKTKLTLQKFKRWEPLKRRCNFSR